MPKYLTTDEIRDKFINFFEKEHRSARVESSSLVPDNPTILLTSAGMVQFVPIFLGYKQPPYNPPRATTCQKCARAGGKDSDIENVGKTPRHHTFFEMLGNFSFGDYFKKEVIPWAWDFVTNRIGLEKDRLWVTVYQEDDEAYDIWVNSTGIPKERVLRKGKKDNFWGPPGPTGPCGPCTEIHYDLGEHLKCSDNCSIDTCECDRWVEIWNLVFMELFQDEDGNLTPLEKKNVDTGMGLERMAMVVQGKTSTFETDLLKNILDEVSKMSGVEYAKNPKKDISLRIITDHARCVSFMISDGITPGNEGRNYVLRMIMRRALRHGKILGMEIDFLHKLVPVIVKNYGKTYPQLVRDEKKIIDIISKEENQFKQTLDRGQKLLDELLEEALKGDKKINGENAFKLYDTFGFPLELTVEIAHEAGVSVDTEAFKEEMELQKQRAKAAAQKVVLTDELVYAKIEQEKGYTAFVGYDENECKQAKVTALVKDVDAVEKADEGEIVDIILDKTPFYAESGGQIGDTGTIEGKNFKAEVLNTFKVNKLFAHRAKITQGEISVNDVVLAAVDFERRREIRAHHTLAHLLQAALIKVLGDEVKQAGSQVEQTRARFDFSFFRAMTKTEINKVEELINSWISQNICQKTDVLEVEEAKKQGAIALFNEKYEDKVRVVKVGDISKELCGGTHALSTLELRLAKVISESAVSAGARRIEAVCSNSAFKILSEKADELDKIAHNLKIKPEEVESRIEKLLEENKELQAKAGELKGIVARAEFETLLSKAKEFEGGKLVIAQIGDFEPNVVKNAIDSTMKKIKEGIIVLISAQKGIGVGVLGKDCAASDKGGFMAAAVSESFVKKGVQAGKIVQIIAQKCSGSGGGKPNFAQGGIKDPSKIEQALTEVELYLNSIRSEKV